VAGREVARRSARGWAPDHEPMTEEAGSLRDVWTALTSIRRRLDDLAGSVARLEPDAPTPEPAGEPLDEAERAALADLVSLLGVGPQAAPADTLLLVLDRLIHRVGADCAAILLAGPDGGLTPVAHRGFRRGAPAPASETSLAGHAFVAQETLRAREGDQARDRLLHEEGLRHAVAVPLRAGLAAPVGALFAGRRRAAPFEADALRSMTLLADRLALLLGPARPEGAGPAAVPAAFVAELDPHALAAAVAREAARVLDAPVVAVLAADDGALRVLGAVGLAAEPGDAPWQSPALAAVLATRRPWDATEDAVDAELGRRLGMPARLAVPLLHGDTLLGVVVAGAPHRLEAARLDSLLAGAALALRNARLHAQAVAALTELPATPAEPAPPGAPTRDFASLLAVIVGRLALIRERVEDAGARRELDVAEEAAWRAAEAVRGLMGFAPGHRAEALRPLDLGAVLRAAVAEAQARWSARLAEPPALDLQLEPLPPVRGSAQDLAEALEHLLDNALEATADGGATTLRARWDGGPHVEVVIEDRGAGMDEATRARASEPFFSTRGPGRLGLGLPVAQAIVARHRGELELASAPGLGTTVRVRLPTVAGGRRRAPRRAAPVRVLVVDDEATVRDTLVDVLGQLGHAVATAGSTAEALAAIAREPIDVVMTDLSLAGGSGLDLARAITRDRPGTPVILVTAWPGHLDAAHLEGSGVAAVVEKPVGLAEVRAALEAVLERRRARRP
jgi:signal transduction histidine kinase/CheY-like chemotaxis protein